MPKPLNADEVIEYVAWLEHDQGPRIMRERTERFHDLYAMRLFEDLPEHLTRGKTRDIPSPFLQELAQAIQAERHSYQTSVTLVARDNTPQGTVDRIEKWLAIKVAGYLSRWLAVDEGGWHQLVSYAGILVWHPSGAGEDRIETPDVLSSFFPVAGAPARAKTFGRRYMQLIRDIENGYAGRKGSAAGPDARPYLKSDETWDWIKLSDDRPANAWGAGTSSGASPSSKWGKDCEMVTLDDGYYCYHVAKNLSTDQMKGMGKGMLLWRDENRAGADEEGTPASSALIVPGMKTGMREPRDRLLPFLMPGHQYVHAINFIRSVRASKSENNKGDVLVDVSDPEMQQAAATVGNLVARRVQMERGGNPNIIEVAGKPMLWERLPDPDLEALELAMVTERNSWANSLREISDPQQLAQMNTNVYLPHAAARRRLLQPLLDYTDWAMKSAALMALNALQYNGTRETTVFATGKERYGQQSREMSAGESVKISWNDVKDFDARFLLIVATNSMTEAEQRQRLLDHENKVMMGYATKRQGISVAGYSDEEAQVLELAIDEVYQQGAALVDPLVPITLQEIIRTSGGILLPLNPEPAPAGGGAPPVAPGANTVEYRTPAIPGAASSSAPQVA